jgi:hypothetical protein
VSPTKARVYFAKKGGIYCLGTYLSIENISLMIHIFTGQEDLQHYKLAVISTSEEF